VYGSKGQTDVWSITLATIGAASAVAATSPSLARPCTGRADAVPRPSVQAPAWVREPAKRPHEVPVWFRNPSLRDEDTRPTTPAPTPQDERGGEGSSAEEVGLDAGAGRVRLG